MHAHEQRRYRSVHIRLRFVFPLSVMKDGALTTTILIFNTALANHLLAIHENSDQSLEYLQSKETVPFGS
jgi:hypothetical protein